MDDICHCEYHKPLFMALTLEHWNAWESYKKGNKLGHRLLPDEWFEKFYPDDFKRWIICPERTLRSRMSHAPAS